MKTGKVLYKDIFAGIITEDENGYSFTYDEDYLSSENAEQISLTLPLQKETFNSKTMFPFFDGLIPEGWLLDIAEANWKINSRDRMSLLLTFCKDCIGAVGVVPYDNELVKK
jgi:serine/threonine-protein kinase HipA